MKATLLEDKLTPLAPLDVVRAKRAAYRAVTGAPIADATLAIFMAHTAFETGRWKKFHWFNFGNIKAGEDYEGFYTLFRCNELINGTLRWFEPPHPQCRFRAYPDATAGARDYFKLLINRTRFFPAWGAAHKGDWNEFVYALKAGGYFTATLAPYKRAIGSLTAEYAKLISEMEPETIPNAPPIDVEHSATSDEDVGELLPLVWDTDEWKRDRDAAIREDS